MKAIELKTEYMNCPIGLDIQQPRFFWKNDGGINQTAYRVQVFFGDLQYWDSGKVLSHENTHITYKGKNLPPKSRIDFQVSLWDENDSQGEISSSYFETGFMNETFSGNWITGNYVPKKNTRYPVDYFRKKFTLTKDAIDARLYITSKGVYRVSVNGCDIEDFILAPGVTDYRKRLQYQVYDVTDCLKIGENEICVILGDGWYRGSIGCFGKTNVFGRITSFICQLELKDRHGDKTVILSDDTWDWSNDGQIRFADLKDGEIIDSTMMPSYRNKAKIDLNHNGFKIVSSDNVYVKKHEHFCGKVIRNDGKMSLIDFGQNIAGVLAFRVTAKKGNCIKIRLGEMLDEKGDFTQVNFQQSKPVSEFGKLTEILMITGNMDKIHKKMQKTPLQEISYICKEGENRYETTFSVFGFRYAMIESDVSIENLNIEAIAVYSDLEWAGMFTSSDLLLNQLFSNTCWSMKNNFLDVPTDCPTRERLGWTGDGQIFFNTASYLALIPTFYRKWLRDMKDNQKKNGKISAVVPYNGMSLVYDNTGSSAGWADASIIIPYYFYKRYGDTEILEECFEMMMSSIHYMISNCGGSKKYSPFSKYIYEKGIHLGEWLEPEEFKDMDNSVKGKVIKQEEVATAYLYNSLKIYLEVCDVLKRNEDRAIIEEYLEGTKKAYQYCFVSNFDYSTTRQAKMVRPLKFGLYDNETKNKLAKCLALSVKRRKGKIGTGFLSTSYLLPVLADNGYIDEAYETLLNEEIPGFLYQVKNGATTIWETWENDCFSSKDHYAFGSVTEFFFAYILGIKLKGKNEFIIKPMITDRLKHVSGYYDSIYGKVSVDWRNDSNSIVLDVTVPPNCRATISFCATEKEVSCGKYYFEKRKDG